MCVCILASLVLIVFVIVVVIVDHADANLSRRAQCSPPLLSSPLLSLIHPLVSPPRPIPTQTKPRTAISARPTCNPSCSSLVFWRAVSAVWESILPSDRYPSIRGRMMPSCHSLFKMCRKPKRERNETRRRRERVIRGCAGRRRETRDRRQETPRTDDLEHR